ncbi:MAG: PAS domain S-box protein [Deltaproteobacteria bacterium]
MIGKDPEQRIRLLEEELLQCRQAEDALREGEERYRNVVENANEGIHIAQDERLVYMNPKLVEISGISFAEAKDRPFTDFVYPDDRAMVLDRYRRRLAGENITDSYEYRALGRGNRIIWFNISTKKIEWNGRPATLNLLTDITARKLVEEALQERIKELNCLSSFSDLINKADGMEEIFQGTVALLTSGWYYPEMACARIKVSGREFKTGNFKETAWKMSAPIIMQNEAVGLVEVGYLEERPPRDEGPFLKEERALLNAVAERLGKVSERKKFEKEREILIAELKQALSEIKQLTGMLPICSSCKKIRTDEGYWEQIEVYIRDHSEAEFSHGLCPECAKKIYPDFFNKE